MDKVQLLGMPVTLGRYSEFVETICTQALNKQSGYTCVANVHMIVEASRNRNFASVVDNASVITPDGKPLTWALQMLYGIHQDRVAGMDLLPDLVKEASLKKISVYFYGGSNELLMKTRLHLEKEYGTLNIAGMCSPPFRLLTEEEESECVRSINDSGAQLVFVVLGCPKQEQWMASMKGKINAMMIGIGGALPVMIHLQKRAPKWMQDAGLEWLHRLLLDPRRLLTRYLVTNSIFLFLLIRANMRRMVGLPYRLTRIPTQAVV